MQPAPALAATLLFCSQPLLWGHAFINPKDLPFMAFFIASVSLGLDMVDRFKSNAASKSDQDPSRSGKISAIRGIMGKWRAAGGVRKVTWLITGISFLISIAAFQPLRDRITQALQQAYPSGSSSFIQTLLDGFANKPGAAPLDASMVKIEDLSAWIMLALCGALLVLWIYASRKIFASFLDQTALAGCFLGMCSSIRTLGPAAGILVGLYFLAGVKKSKAAWIALAKYLTVAGATAVLFWPFLWENPVQNYFFSVAEAARFPWSGIILFAGKIYTKDSLPDSFLPSLLCLQFTETALILAIIGACLAIACAIQKPELRMDTLLLGAWLILPLLAAILMHSTVYNNFRQFLFAVPPIFVFAGLALKALWERMQHKPYWFSGLCFLLLLPGIYWGIRLHPYEYIYYNSLTGGVRGAFRNYELDYWGISYKDAIEYINRVAPSKATVIAKGQFENARIYARPDLSVLDFSARNDESFSSADYAILSSQFGDDEFIFSNYPIIFQVERDGAPLAVVKQLNPQP